MSRAGRLSFSGSTTAQPVRVPIVQDGIVESTEGFFDLTGPANPAALTMNADKSVKAVFAPEPSEALLLAAALVSVAFASRPARRRAQARGGRMID